MSNEVSNHHGFTKEDLIERRRKGLPKPPEVPWAIWNEPFKLSNQHEVIANLAAHGASGKQIAEEVGLSYMRVNQLLNSDRLKFRIKELQYKYFGKNLQKRFEALGGTAIDTISEIMENKNEKGATRLSAAREVLDRALGKPKQTIEHRDSKLANLYDKLDDVLGNNGSKAKSAEEIIEDVDWTVLDTKQDEKHNGVERKVDSDESFDQELADMEDIIYGDEDNEEKYDF